MPAGPPVETDRFYDHSTQAWSLDAVLNKPSSVSERALPAAATASSTLHFCFFPFSPAPSLHSQRRGVQRLDSDQSGISRSDGGWVAPKLRASSERFPNGGLREHWKLPNLPKRLNVVSLVLDSGHLHAQPPPPLLCLLFSSSTLSYLTSGGQGVRAGRDASTARVHRAHHLPLS
jgi:hypothetical protein